MPLGHPRARRRVRRCDAPLSRREPRALGDGVGSANGGTDIIEKAEVIWDEEEDCNKGWGFVVFHNAEQRSAAVRRGTVKVRLDVSEYCY
mgnify:CR=1 FL=1